MKVWLLWFVSGGRGGVEIQAMAFWGFSIEKRHAEVNYTFVEALNLGI